MQEDAPAGRGDGQGLMHSLAICPDSQAEHEQEGQHARALRQSNDLDSALPDQLLKSTPSKGKQPKDLLDMNDLLVSRYSNAAPEVTIQSVQVVTRPTEDQSAWDSNVIPT